MKHSSLRGWTYITRAKAWQTWLQPVWSELRKQASCEQMCRFTGSTADRWRSRPAHVAPVLIQPGEPFQRDQTGKTSRWSRINIYMAVRNYGWDCDLDGTGGQWLESAGKMIICLSHLSGSWVWGVYENCPVHLHEQWQMLKSKSWALHYYSEI